MPPAISPNKMRWLAPAKTALPLLVIAILGTLAVVSLLALSAPAGSAQYPPNQRRLRRHRTLDKNGEVTIEVPIAVTTEHRSFTYQAKPIGKPMPNLFIKSELSNNRFVIAGGAPGGTISWQLVGTRNNP